MAAHAVPKLCGARGRCRKSEPDQFLNICIDLSTEIPQIVVSNGWTYYRLCWRAGSGRVVINKVAVVERPVMGAMPRKFSDDLARRQNAREHGTLIDLRNLDR